MKCDDCGLDKPDVEECECPYASEIYEEVVIASLCDDCYDDRRMDV